MQFYKEEEFVLGEEAFKGEKKIIYLKEDQEKTV